MSPTFLFDGGASGLLRRLLLCPPEAGLRFSRLLLSPLTFCPHHSIGRDVLVTTIPALFSWVRSGLSDGFSAFLCSVGFPILR